VVRDEGRETEAAIKSRRNERRERGVRGPRLNRGAMDEKRDAVITSIMNNEI
jgi:hypothetical protein